MARTKAGRDEKSEEENAPIPLLSPFFHGLGPPGGPWSPLGRPSSLPLVSLRNSGQSAPQERSAE
eukprot:5287321-Pyramimonas_sp.AAC.1